ncbi:helicase C-terminal domain-containing protein [Paenibacillus thermotolerans]|uniref:helicase C-terminal domain-containing protein n=1 Tax=Paenibacillus thermotolerans TaxID=3027807 RepID=UPI0023675B66|nr:MULTISPECIES: helicase C-terminal domain-containing protein [unclassified Paenibacillus]
MQETVQISVRAFVEYAYRSGDIDYGFQQTVPLTEGTKAHRNIQLRYGERDRKEVFLKTEILYGDLMFVIDGRCDGMLVAEDGSTTIDEIKSTSGKLPSILEETYPVHWAQAKCYAYMAAKEQGLCRIGVQLTYVQVDSGEENRFSKELTFKELERFVMEMVERYYSFAALRNKHLQLRNSSIKALPFPFPSYREGQRSLAAAAYKTILDGKKLFAKAPTGIGKTVSMIFPSVKAIGEGLLRRFFYLTAKTITRTAAEEAFASLQAKGLHLQAVTLTAKEKICFREEVRCTKESCEFADGYYDRVNEALLDMLANETLMTRQVIERYARSHRVCPFEFSLDAAYAADAVICDYNYVFDPRVNLKRMFEDQKRQTAVLIDEAHNLVDRARDMYSSELNKSDFLAVQRVSKGVRPELHAAAKAVNDYFIAMRKRYGEWAEHVERGLPEQLIELVESFASAAEKALAAAGRSGLDDSLLADLYFASQHFVRIAKLYDEKYVTYIECRKSDVRFKLFCLDPSHQLRQTGKGYRAQIAFSATLSPLSYYMDMLGGDSEDNGDYAVSVPSPFAKEQLKIIVRPLSTRYQDREKTVEALVGNLHELVEKQPGNLLFFFPSHEYMNLVYERFTVTGPKIKTILQSANMTEEERERFLAAFESDNGEALAGFAVMGGIFSEGIDLAGDRLTGVAVIGVGLPQLGVERNIMKQYFDSAGKNGFEYAYVFPGMNKVLQAGGRLIRTEQDRGTLILIDDRYLHPQYNRLLPPEWRHYIVQRNR